MKGTKTIHEDDRPRRDGSDRYAVYVVGADGRERRRLAETSEGGIGLTLRTLRNEEQITNNSRVGILDRQTRRWLVNPWGRGL